MLDPVTTQSQTSLDALTGTNQCGASANKVPQTSGGSAEQARCGVGPRLPALVISPYARRNFVDNTFTDQSSIIRFIEDNWLAGEGGPRFRLAYFEQGANTRLAVAARPRS